MKNVIKVIDGVDYVHPDRGEKVQRDWRVEDGPHQWITVGNDDIHYSIVCPEMWLRPLRFDVSLTGDDIADMQQAIATLSRVLAKLAS